MPAAENAVDFRGTIASTGQNSGLNLKDRDTQLSLNDRHMFDLDLPLNKGSIIR